jgi:ABC-type Fe3+/spermidine/putrescine transport system ATPase subunit
MSLKINNLSKRFENLWILKDVSFEARPGEILGLFGLSGVGKSVVLRVLAGMEGFEGGSISYNDEALNDSHKRSFHFPNLTNQSFWKTIFKTRGKSEFADGEGQVYALEIALDKAEGVLLLDNSFCQMDWKLREEKYDRLRQCVREKNLIAVFATNNYEEIFQACDRAAVLQEGEIKQIGTPREIYETPESAAVAAVFGRNNLFAARRLTSSKTENPEFQTLEGNHRLFAASAKKSALGAINQNITLAIRPEHISISFGASFPEDNLIKAQITDIDFLGERTLIQLNADGLNLYAIVLRLVGLNIGDECVVGLPPDRIIVLSQ